MTVSTNNTYNNAPTTASVAGGTIDNAPIGSITPSTGAFTTLSGQILITGTLWVAKNGADANSGSIASPFLTIGAAITAATSGTTIFVQPGTYTENLTLKAGVSIQGQYARTSIVVGNVGAAYSGTVYLHSIDLQASSGSVLTISGASATNLQLDDCHLDGLSGSADTVSYTNTNAASQFNSDNSVITQAVSTSARVIKCAATAAGTIFFEDVSTKILDNFDHVALEVAGAVSFTHNGDQVQGTISVANTAIYNGVNLKLIATSVASLTTNSASATPSTLTNVIHYSSANPLVTGAGLFAQGLNVFAGTGSNFNVTLSGGAGALPLPASMFQLHSSTLAPAGGLAAGYYDGALEYDGTNLYIDVGTARKTIVVNGANASVGTLSAATGIAIGGATAGTGGVAFPATAVAVADPNTLDDYREGTWTPGADVGLTVVGAFSSSGTYVKIGKQVFISGTINGATSVAFSSGGQRFLKDLPFSASVAAFGFGRNASYSASAHFECGGINLYSVDALGATPTFAFSATYLI